jgi:hypothetical protein
MPIFIIIFGILTLLAGIVILINPDKIFGFLRNNLDNLALHILAVVIRLILGILLIRQSDVSKFPFTIEIIGWISIIAAMVFAVMRRSNFNRFMSWALSLVKPFGRVSGILAVAFGAFLVYAFV